MGATGKGYRQHAIGAVKWVVFRAAQEGNRRPADRGRVYSAGSEGAAARADGHRHGIQRETGGLGTRCKGAQ